MRMHQLQQWMAESFSKTAGAGPNSTGASALQLHQQIWLNELYFSKVRFILARVQQHDVREEECD
jgi:hypothetical protein